MTESRNIVVTGSVGTIGTPLVSALRRNGHNVFGLDLAHETLPEDQYARCDIRNFRELERTFRVAEEAMGSVDFVYHLAAEFGRNNGEDYYESLWSTNAIGTKHMIRIQEALGFKMLFAGSSEAYGELPIGVPYSEDVTDKYPLRHFNDYAITKWVNEQQIRNSIQRDNTQTMPLRFFNAYGPGEHYHNYRSVVCLFIYRLLTGRPITVYKGYRRVFMYIDDLIETLCGLPDRFTSGRVYNIGGTDYRSIEELVEMILQIIGKKASDCRITYEPKEKMNIVDKFPDISRARDELGHNPKVTLEEGLPKTIEWMRKAYNL